MGGLAWSVDIFCACVSVVGTLSSVVGSIYMKVGQVVVAPTGVYILRIFNFIVLWIT